MRLAAQYGTLAFRVVAFFSACLAIYIAAFLSEDEEGNLQNRLEKWWVRLDDEKISGYLQS